jgi:class 3 adenylate cyclase
MSPEQADGLDTDHRSDLFSLGSLYYETLTGGSPFKVNNPIQTLLRVLSHQPPPVHEVNPAIPRELSQLISQLLEKDRNQRPSDADLVARTLDRMVGHEISSYITLALSDRTRPGEDETLSVIPASEPAGEGRRHRVTVLVGELSGPAAMDAKRLFELRPAFRRLTAEVLEHFGGFPGRLTDRGFLACFGYPESGEDDARRAVNAARQVLRRVERLAADGAEVEVRLGIHSGTVAASPRGGGDDALAFGVTGEVASELARRASPGQFYLSEPTHRRIAAYFQCDPLPGERLERGPSTVEVYRVVGDRV